MGLPLLLYPRFRFRRGETGPPRDKRQPFVWFARGMPPLSFFNRVNHGLAGHDLARIKQFLDDYKSGNLHFLKFRSPVFYSLWKDVSIRSANSRALEILGLGGDRLTCSP